MSKKICFYIHKIWTALQFTVISCDISECDFKKTKTKTKMLAKNSLLHPIASL